MKIGVLILAIELSCLAGAANAQAPEELLRSTSQYVKSRSTTGKEIIWSPAKANEELHKPQKPLIIDLRAKKAFDEVHVKGSERLTLQDMITPDVLARLPKGQPILVLDDQTDVSIEAVVLLRLLGRTAFTVRSGANAVFNEARSTEGKSSDPAKSSEILAGPLANTPSADPSRSPTPSPPKAPEPQPIPAWVYFVIGGLVLLSGLMGLWFGVLQPRRKARPLLEAIKLLAGGGDTVLEKAEALLTQAVNSGLKPLYQMQARFLLAYVKARRGRYQEALVALNESGDTSREAAYLHLWLTVRAKKWDDAERVCYEQFDTLKGYLQSNELAGILYLELARQAMALRRYDRALSCFQKVKDLGVYADHVPEHLADLELVLAISELFEGKGKVTSARERFEAARKAAEGANRSTLIPRIGLLLCDWRESEQPAIDQPLAEILNEVKAAAVAKDKSEAAAVLPAVSLWYAVSLVYEWLRTIPKDRGLPPSDRKQLEHRLELVREKMPEEGDPYLIAGLVDYYCARDENRRIAAVDLLRKAIDLGVTLPEIRYIVQCEDRLAEQSKHRFDSYLALLRGYLADASVSLDLRKELHEHLRKFERFQSLEEIAVDDASSLTPSLHDISASCELIEQRMERIFRGYDAEQRTTVEGLLGGLRKSREELHRTVGELGKTEQKLMRVAGETLLPEDIQAEA